MSNVHFVDTISLYIMIKQCWHEHCKIPGMDIKAITIRIPKEIYKYLKVYCAKNDLTMALFINDAIREKIKKIDTTKDQ